MKRVYIVVEGQTEQEFVNSVVAPYLNTLGIYSVTPVLIRTSRSGRGGMVNYSHLENTVKMLLQSSSTDFIITTFIDFFRLPTNMPEYDECSFSPLDDGAEIGVCDTVQAKDGSLWYYIKHNGKYGFVHSAYVAKKVSESEPDSPVSMKVDYARSKNDAFSGTYETTANLNLRTGAGTGKPIQLTIPKGDKVTCYGFYTAAGGVNWYLVAYQTKTGFVSSEYLKRQ